MKIEKKFEIKEKIDGRDWEPLVALYATSWADAKKQFAGWVFSWLDEKNTDEACEACEEISAAMDTFSWDNATWTIRRVI